MKRQNANMNKPWYRPLTMAINAWRRPLRRRAALPPGELIQLDDVERTNRKILLQQAVKYGPVFKILSGDQMCVCVFGFARGRRLLKEQAANMRPVTLDLQKIIPEGFIRQMQGDCHRRYRDALNRGVNAISIKDFEQDLVQLTRNKLAGALSGQAARTFTPHEYQTVLSDIASGMLIRVFFGAQPDTRDFDRLADYFHQLGPHGIVWNIGPQQIDAFTQLRDALRAQLSAKGNTESSDLLGRLASFGDIDDTLLGNLIYMVEMGRYDLRALFRWISKYSANHPDWIERIANESDEDAHAETRPAAEAFVIETLRMDQSERLLRRVKQAFEFEGFLIPEGAMVRICMWESHKDNEEFPEPFSFDPSRFLSVRPQTGKFSPFGLDHHQCPFSAISVSLAVIFLRTLAQGYQIRGIGNGPPVRGAYHWEPSPKFSVELTQRSRQGERHERR